jgi:hypothetical protein
MSVVVCRGEVSHLEREIDSLKRAVDGERKKADDLIRERDLLNKLKTQAEHATHKQIDLIKINENTKRNLEQEMNGYKLEAQKQAKVTHCALSCCACPALPCRALPCPACPALPCPALHGLISRALACSALIKSPLARCPALPALPCPALISRATACTRLPVRPYNLLLCSVDCPVLFCCATSQLFLSYLAGFELQQCAMQPCLAWLQHIWRRRHEGRRPQGQTSTDL